MRGSEEREAGYVTAEAAVVIPALVLLFGMLLWGVMAAAAHIQCIDGARAGARAAARGEQAAAVRSAVRSAAPRGAVVVSEWDGRLVRVHVRARTAGPGPLTLGLSAEAVAMAEDRDGGGEHAGR
ncbi:TadE family type IV pilus minor pilin [Streptomyces winkii]|uniref:TadE family type IV pilus minor pilin n=1 Tax=Streptomyces winkii TaxID=3051178 RepID=UPI0028D363DA|nr:TadE family type IV pilus minor pilin [Streptomyces sp. DSM 40971]